MDMTAQDEGPQHQAFLVDSTGPGIHNSTAERILEARHAPHEQVTIWPGLSSHVCMASSFPWVCPFELHPQADDFLAAPLQQH